ncbi:MAG: leucine-rich repeat domain-containing protein, partial [Chitinophagaceae bacterium]|nr:leucine-rich repeat domain-containing protein [Chitinophagaceae bacterium]
LFELSGEQITRFPPFLRYCKKLDNLHISNTSITTLPDWIAELQNLSVLDLAFNKIKQLPASLFQLPLLENIGLHGNEIDSIPPLLFRLPRLQSVDLSYNPFSQVPREIAQAKKLTYFSVDGSKLTYEDYKKLRKLVPARVEIPHDSPFHFEDETKPCYSEVRAYKTPEGFVQNSEDPYVKGGNKVWAALLSKNIDTALVVPSIAGGKGEQTDSVVVMFLVMRNGGLVNLRYKYAGNAVLKETVKKIMLAACPYWVPGSTGGRHINSWSQLVFTFTASAAPQPALTVVAKNPLPSPIREFILEEE